MNSCQATELDGHDPSASDQLVQRQLVDDKPRRRRIRAPHSTALAFHARCQAGGNDLAGCLRHRDEQRTRVILGLQQPVDDAGRPDVQPAGLVLVFLPRAE